MNRDRGQEEDKDEAEAAELRREPTRVILAEDDQELRRLIANALRNEGYEVWEAANGAELLDRLDTFIEPEAARDPPHLIISDVRMPAMTGMEALAGLKESSLNVPVVLMTAFGDEQTHEQACRLGAVAFFDKPFRIKDLLRAIRAICGPVTWNAAISR